MRRFTEDHKQGFQAKAEMAVQQFCLRWNNHQPNFISVFTHLLSTESLVDVTLAAEGKHLQAHRVVLSACSPYFQMLFSMNPCQHPIVILKDVKYDDLKIMVDFMYYGEVNISHEQLPAILKTAELLKVKGLAENSDPGLTKQASGSSDRAELLTPGESAWDSASRRSPSPLSVAAKRKRLRKSSTGSGSGSTERGTSEELLTGEVTLVPSPALVKTESSGFPVVQSSGGGSTDADSGGTGRSADSSLRTGGQEPSTDSEPRNGSHDSTDDDPLSIHIPQEGEGSKPKVEPNVSEYNQGDTQSQQSHQMHISPQGLLWCLPELPSYLDPAPAPQGPPLRPALPTSRRRSNPQAGENFSRALDAVRFGGLGFCKAARIYGVNNRTLWLEYRRRGYPVARPRPPRGPPASVRPVAALPATAPQAQQLVSSFANCPDPASVVGFGVVSQSSQQMSCWT